MHGEPAHSKQIVKLKQGLFFKPPIFWILYNLPQKTYQTLKPSVHREPASFSEQVRYIIEFYPIKFSEYRWWRKAKWAGLRDKSGGLKEWNSPLTKSKSLFSERQWNEWGYFQIPKLSSFQSGTFENSDFRGHRHGYSTRPTRRGQLRVGSYCKGLEGSRALTCIERETEGN